MNAIINSIFDSYGRRARLYPALIALFPAITLVSTYTDWFSLQAKDSIWFALLGAGLFILSDTARQRGKAVEKRLLQKWEGFPSKTLLRHRDLTLDPQTKARYHRAAERLIDDLTIPSQDEEARNPEAADDAYETVTKFLLPRTRDRRQFGLLFEENVSYGFRRNLLGLKPVGIAVVFGSVVYVTWLSWDQIAVGSVPKQPESLLLAGAIAMFVAWIGLVRERNVRSAAVDYAQQLLMTLDVL